MSTEHSIRSRSHVTSVMAFIMVVTSTSPALARTAATRSCRSRPECVQKLRREAIEEAVEQARVQRAEVLVKADALRGAGDPRAVASYLGETAAELDDPVLAVEAAEARLGVPGLDGLRETRRDLEIARAMIAGLSDPEVDSTRDARTARVDRSEVGALSKRCDAIEVAVAQRIRRLTAKAKVERRGRQELGAGTVMASLGVGGLVLLAGGLGVVHDRNEKLEKVRGNEAAYDLTSLDAQHTRGTAMVASGAVIAAMGLVIGATVIGVGVRDIRSGRSRRDERVRVVPAVGGFVFMGRF